MLPLIAFISGILFTTSLSELPVFSWYYVIVSVLISLLRLIDHKYLKHLYLIGCYLLGTCWALWSGQQIINDQLIPELEGEEIIVYGDIVDLPEQRGLNQRFLFAIEKAELIEASSHSPISIKTPKRVLLTNYQSPKNSAKTMEVGQAWCFVVKLKRPRSMVNEGGFDYQRWLLSQKIGATGYIRQSHLNQQLPSENSYPVQKFRSHLLTWLLSNAPEKVQGPLIALAIGDNSYISQEHWQLFRETGTGHLMAISGLHVGLVALFGFFIGRLLVTALATINCQWLWIYLLPGLISCCAALSYSALAGFGLPTQRALIMVVFFNIALLARREPQPLRALLFAAVVVLLIDPLAGWDMGFWLSFGAVAALLGYFMFRRRVQAKSTALRFYEKILSVTRAQFVVFVGLFLPLLIFNVPLSLSAPIANLIVIPLVSFFVVIPLLIAIAMLFVSETLSVVLLNFSAWSLETSFSFLSLLINGFDELQWYPESGTTTWPLLLIAVVGVFLIMQGKGFPGRWLGLVLIIPGLLPSQNGLIKEPISPLKVTVLDVGQGLAIVAQTPSYTLLYDAGAKLSDDFNIGEAVVLPFLRHNGIQKLDSVVISHGDNDHIGGLEAVLKGITVDQLVVGEDVGEDFGKNVGEGLSIQQTYLKLPEKMDVCNRDFEWEVEGIQFRFIEPKFQVKKSENNNLSCVLLISYRDQHILLPGDIEASVERSLVHEKQLPNSIALVIAPHHGSRTSSTRDFVNFIQTKSVVFSAAYKGRYGHPHPAVTKRYLESGADLYNTADSGQLKFIWNETGQLSVESLRSTRKRFWY